MRNDVHFWIATLSRAFVALVFGSAVIAIPDLAKLLLLRPFAIAVSVLFLATYGLLDSAIVFVTSFMADSPRARLALRVQGCLGTAIAVFLLTIAFERARLQWFLYFVACQALVTGIGEGIVARHRRFSGASGWNHAAASIAITAAVLYGSLGLFYTAFLTASEIAWLLFAYLAAFGMAECLTSARMLYADRQLAVRLAGHQLQEERHHVAIGTSHIA